jgi:aspartyl-tRNA(Asn)/glutamyl-tRNA(Gln) amidotransferase subunit B
MEYETVIGLEIHAELKTKTKMFCDSLNNPDSTEPNLNICPVCTGQPGALPVINKEAIAKMVEIGQALNCSIEKETFFERKNYFYPDLPKGYQISQFQKPLCRNGHLDIGKKIRIERVHLEEDAGKLIHEKNATLVDYNRAGVPLMELVTEPDLTTGDEVRRFAQELQLILRYLGASEANMEKGQMRVEVNISLKEKGAKELGTKVEIKNLNSIKAAADSVDYEIKRQTKALDAGEEIVQETRGWNENKKQTFSQRIKEGSADYRYFPEPDLPPLRLEDAELDVTLPELPQQRRERFAKEYGLPEKDTEIFVVNKVLGDYYEKVVSELASWERLGHIDKPADLDHKKLSKLASNYLITELQKIYRERELNFDVDGINITPENFAEFIFRTHSGEVSSSGAQALLKEMFETGKDPSDIISEKDLGQVSDSEELSKAVQEVISENEKSVEDYKKGNENAIQFLVGQMMKKTKGKANPQLARELLEKELK